MNHDSVRNSFVDRFGQMVWQQAISVFAASGYLAVVYNGNDPRADSVVATAFASHLLATDCDWIYYIDLEDLNFGQQVIDTSHAQTVNEYVDAITKISEERDASSVGVIFTAALDFIVLVTFESCYFAAVPYNQCDQLLGQSVAEVLSDAVIELASPLYDSHHISMTRDQYLRLLIETARGIKVAAQARG